MKLRRHFVLAALAGKRKPLPALFCSRCEGLSTDSFCPITLNSCPITQSPPPVKRVVRDAGYKPALLASV